MTESRGGQRASRPPQGWDAPARLDARRDPLSVMFIEETGARSRVFDFSGLPVQAGVQEWLARGFARMTGPRAGAKRLATANSYALTVRRFASSLAEAGQPVSGPAGITPVRIKAFGCSSVEVRA